MNVWDEYKWKIWDLNKEPLPEKPNKYRKISIVTTCMGRTYDLKKTLPVNIKQNETYPDIEFVLINYNSKDDMDEWVKSELTSHLETGKVVYYKTTEPKYYEMHHSRNIGFKVATGEIINSVDADNYTGEDFAEKINLLAELRPKKAIFSKGKRQMHGRIGLYKKDFLYLGGYDEDLTGYGFDDHSVVYRGMALGYKLMWWGTIVKMDRIKTSRNIVGKNMKIHNWRSTEEINKAITFEKLKQKDFIVNSDRHWGKAHLIKNFKEEIDI